MTSSINVMPKAFQKFDLDLEALAELYEKNPGGLNGVQVWRALKEELREKGYEVLKSGDNYGGLPASIIVGAGIDKSAKDDFYGITERFKLPYRSGDYYS